MKKVILLKGLPASGKSTWAKNLIAKHPGVYKRVNKDDLRAMLDGGQWSKGNEKFILELRDHIIKSTLLLEQKSIIVDDTNLHPKHAEQVMLIAQMYGAVYEEKFFEASVEDCIERDLKRPVSVGEKVIRGMWEQFLKPKEEPIVQDPSLRHAIICDLDGTLALLNGRNPYDASTCEQDLLNEPVARIIEDAIRRNVSVIFVSGREKKYIAQTMGFLMKHFADRVENFSYSLHMRMTDDRRKDAVVKREIFDNEIRGKFFIEFVLDDRNQVVEMWRSLGLTCFQVAPGDF